MAYSKEIIEKVFDLVVEGKSTQEISKEFSISASTIYNWKKKYEKEIFAKKECLRVYETILLLIQGKNYLAGLMMASNEKFEQYNKIQFLRIKCLIKLQRYKEAYDLASEERFKEDFLIQSQRITCLIKLKRYEEAYDLASEERFKEDFVIQSLRITCLLKLQRYKEAYDLASEERFKKHFPIQSQKKWLMKFKNKGNTSFKKVKRDGNYSSNDNISLKLLLQLKDLGMNSYKIAEEQILSSNILEWQKVILICAMYEKVNYPVQGIVNYLKRQKSIYENHALVLNIIQELLIRAKSKNKRYDSSFYENLLNRNIDLSPDIEKEKNYLLSLAQNLSPEVGEARKRTPKKDD